MRKLKINTREPEKNVATQEKRKKNIFNFRNDLKLKIKIDQCLVLLYATTKTQKRQKSIREIKLCGKIYSSFRQKNGNREKERRASSSSPGSFIRRLEENARRHAKCIESCAFYLIHFFSIKTQPISSHKTK